MKYWVDFESEGFEVTVINENGTERVIINGDQHEAELIPLDDKGTYVAFLNNSPLIFHVEFKGNGEIDVKLPDVTHRMNIIKSVGRSGARSKTQISGPMKVKSPMSGLIVDVMVEAGQKVEKGTPLLVLEAMKMRNEIKAPRDGIIKELKVQKGQTVDTGTVVLTIE